jgi:hypothetical protein
MNKELTISIGRSTRMKKTIVLVCLILLSMTAVAQAGAVMHLGSPPNSGTYLYNGHVLPMDETNLGILENGTGNPALVDPFLLIIGVANVTDADFTAPSITLSTGTGIVGGTNYFGGSWDTTTGYAGSFTAASSDDVYGFIGLTPNGNNSNNFGNWAAADLFVNGITANGFGIFVYSLSGTGIEGGSQVDVMFGSDLNLGTFAVAYGQDSKGKAFSTPFTESGLTVPEPSTFMLFGVGLLSLLFMRRKFEL